MCLAVGKCLLTRTVSRANLGRTKGHAWAGVSVAPSKPGRPLWHRLRNHRTGKESETVSAYSFVVVDVKKQRPEGDHVFDEKDGYNLHAP